MGTEEGGKVKWKGGMIPVSQIEVHQNLAIIIHQRTSLQPISFYYLSETKQRPYIFKYIKHVIFYHINSKSPAITEHY